MVLFSVITGRLSTSYVSIAIRSRRSGYRRVGGLAQQEPGDRIDGISL
jgi:hypothetical protein